MENYWKNMYKIYFSILLFILCSCKSSNKNVLIQGLGKIDQKELELVKNEISGQLTEYSFYTSTENLKLPKSAFINIKSPRYRADTLLKFLLRTKSDTIGHVIGLTDKDISTTKRDNLRRIKKPESKYTDWGIFGLAYVPGESCVVSTKRLSTSNKRKYRDRIKKVCIHEFGHNLGLPHCPTDTCVMQDAVEKISTVDKATPHYCKLCLERLK